jgi:hypothetical protein
MAEFGRLRVKLPWWWRPYLVSAAMVAWLAGKEPDYTKLAETVMHHAKVEVVSE